MKNLINDYKNGLDEISVLLQELRAYTTIKGLDKKTVEDIINHIENITDELCNIHFKSNSFPECTSIEEMKLYSKISEKLYSSLQEYCNIVIKTDFEYMFNDLQEDKLNKIFCRISELFALSMGFITSAKKYCRDNNIFDLMIYNS